MNPPPHHFNSGSTAHNFAGPPQNMYHNPGPGFAPPHNQATHNHVYGQIHYGQQVPNFQNYGQPPGNMAYSGQQSPPYQGYGHGQLPHIRTNFGPPQQQPYPASYGGPSSSPPHIQQSPQQYSPNGFSPHYPPQPRSYPSFDNPQEHYVIFPGSPQYQPHQAQGQPQMYGSRNGPGQASFNMHKRQSQERVDDEKVGLIENSSDQQDDDECISDVEDDVDLPTYIRRICSKTAAFVQKIYDGLVDYLRKLCEDWGEGDCVAGIYKQGEKAKLKMGKGVDKSTALMTNRVTREPALTAREKKAAKNLWGRGLNLCTRLGDELMKKMKQVIKEWKNAGKRTLDKVTEFANHIAQLARDICREIMDLKP
ncbi:hypothetical protein DFH27DRAFT_398746 [Peziza echinospora]|nr:hypothetical protein DFH27DRAFT_398746 [Peziza echinospora]